MSFFKNLEESLLGASPDDVKQAAAQRSAGMKNPGVMAKAQDLKKKRVLQDAAKKISGGGKAW